MYVPSGLKNKTANLHTTTTKVKIDHTIRPLLTHMVPPAPPQEHTKFLCGGEGIVFPPLLTLTGLEEEAKEPLLLFRCKMNQCTTKINKYD